MSKQEKSIRWQTFQWLRCPDVSYHAAVGLRSGSSRFAHIDVLAVLRVRQWAHFVVLPLATLDRDLAESFVHTLFRVGMGCLVASLALGYAYGLNAIADRKSDQDDAKNPLIGVGVLPANLWVAISLVGAGALFGALWNGSVAFVATSISVIAGTIYSVGPRLKAYPVVGTVLNAGIFGPLLAVSLPDMEVPRGFMLRFASFLVLLMQNQLLHECADDNEDSGASVLTTARMLGERSVARVVAGMGILGALAGFFFAPSMIVALVNAMVLVAVTIFTLRGTMPPAKRRILHRFWSLAAGAVIFAASFGPATHWIGTLK